MFLAFGEVMLRVAPEGFLRFRQVLPGRMDCTFGGAEANVCVALANLGAKVRYLTALPKNPIADALVAELRRFGIDTAPVLRRDAGRLGIYFLEAGANQRPSVVIYDRAGSAVSLAAPDEYDWDAALDGVTWVHTTGITPSLSENAFLATLKLVQEAKARGCTVSCDMNYRKKLWKWRPGTEQQALARECMSQVMQFVDLVVGNEEDASKVFGVEAAGTSVEEGKIDAAAYEQVARTLIARFPNLSRVAITLRESISASHNNWGGMLFDREADRAFFAPLDASGDYRPYEIRNIVDRVGGGDSFAAGLLYALTSTGYAEPQLAIRFAVAASCLKHSVQGDFNWTSADEAASLMKGTGSGRVKR